VICGQQTGYYDLALSGNTGMIFVVFNPCGAGLFFETPMNEITNQNLAFEHLVKEEAYVIEDQIQNANSTQERIKIIEDFLIRKLIRNHRNYNHIILIFNLINKSKGSISVKKLAESSCLSIKQFERKFSELVGLNPKRYLRIVRFQNILHIRESKFFEDFSALAIDCGYYDQSHFIHDFKEITDLSPKAFFEMQVG
jgi:AraC-like DNA-binding protein